MLLITLQNITVTRSNDGNDFRSEQTNHYLTDLTLPQFLIRYGQLERETIKKYSSVGMKGWWNVLNCVEIHPTQNEIEEMTNNSHFTCDVFEIKSQQDVEGKDIIICTECEKQDLKSQVIQGATMCQKMYKKRTFYDENGKKHFHDGSISSTDYHCDKGHNWTKTRTGSCWCGWKGEI